MTVTVILNPESSSGNLIKTMTYETLKQVQGDNLWFVQHDGGKI